MTDSIIYIYIHMYILNIYIYIVIYSHKKHDMVHEQRWNPGPGDCRAARWRREMEKLVVPICLHCPSLTWKLKMMVSKRNLQFYLVPFSGCMLNFGRVFLVLTRTFGKCVSWALMTNYPKEKNRIPPGAAFLWTRKKVCANTKFWGEWDS